MLCFWFFFPVLVRPAGHAGRRTSLSCWSGVSLMTNMGYKFDSFIIWCLKICLPSISSKRWRILSILQASLLALKGGGYIWTPVSAQDRLPHWASRTLFILTVFWRETINSFIWWSLTREEVQKVKLCVLSAFPSNREQSYAMICPNKRDVFPL